MSNRRKGGLKNLYRTEFLRSPAWFARRDRWFTEQHRRGLPLACAACDHPATPREIELHHLDYRGVTITAGVFRAAEKHADLLPLHPYCHDLLHRLIDRDEILARHRTRRDATTYALTHLRPRLAARKDAS